jgi:hypothetical protein
MNCYQDSTQTTLNILGTKEQEPIIAGLSVQRQHIFSFVKQHYALYNMDKNVEEVFSYTFNAQGLSKTFAWQNLKSSVKNQLSYPLHKPSLLPLLIVVCNLIFWYWCDILSNT